MSRVACVLIAATTLVACGGGGATEAGTTAPAALRDCPGKPPAGSERVEATETVSCSEAFKAIREWESECPSLGIDRPVCTMPSGYDCTQAQVGQRNEVTCANGERVVRFET